MCHQALGHTWPPSRTCSHLREAPAAPDEAHPRRSCLGIQTSRALPTAQTESTGQLVAPWIESRWPHRTVSPAAGQYTFPHLSPDGRRLAVASTESGRASLSFHEPSGAVHPARLFQPPPSNSLNPWAFPRPSRGGPGSPFPDIDVDSRHRHRRARTGVSLELDRRSRSPVVAYVALSMWRVASPAASSGVLPRSRATT